MQCGAILKSNRRVDASDILLCGMKVEAGAGDKQGATLYKVGLL
jgi:hypothetical protein